MIRSALLIVPAAALLLAACEREDRPYRPNPVGDETVEKIVMDPISPGPGQPVVSTSGKGKDYETNAYHLSQGKRFFAWFNCNGCHANGGGGMGPPLMDAKWIYGSAIENVVQTIREGRPNGMPSFRGKIPDDQIWEIAAYVRSMSGLAPKSAAPARNDDMHPHPSENREPRSTPVEGGFVPPSAEMPQ